MKPTSRCLALSLLVSAPLHAESQWYEEMQIGPAWSNTFSDSFQGESRTAALKGILLQLDENHRALFDTETLRLVTAYQGGVEWGGTPWTGAHGKLIGLKNQTPIFNTAAIPGWADESGSFEDKREFPGFGNLSHAKFSGYFRFGDKIVLDYTVNGVRVLESIAIDGETITRSFWVADHDQELVLLLADESGAFEVSGDGVTAKSVEGLQVKASGVKLSADKSASGRLLATFGKAKKGLFQIAYARGAEPKPATAPDFAAWVKGGPALYPEKVETQGVVSKDTNSAYVTDIVTLPNENPWKANMRVGGFDFIDDDTAAVSTWNGDVWTVKGLKGDWEKLTWQRIASGLFETLGLKVVDGVIYVHGRDQITQLIDLNGDGETDHFKVFNRDVLITPNFHEFSFDLQTDTDGNFYFSKASPVRGGGRGFDKILPHNGIVAKVSKDGSKFEILATGLRAPGGLGVGPNGQITTGENEGTWQPRCKLNYFDPKKGPVFLGTEPSRGALKDAPFTEPLCYFPMEIDNSSGSQVWTTAEATFGLKADELLHLSYGQSSIYRVLPVKRGEDRLQGGVVKLPITLQSSAMRARFHTDGSLYAIGFRGWQTNAATATAFQRIRHNEEVTVLVPEKMEYTPTGIRLTFPAKLDQELAEDPASYGVQRWNYVRGPQYGSGEFSVDEPDQAAEAAALEKESSGQVKRDTAEVESAKLLPDGQTVEIVIAGMKPSHQLKVTYDLEDTDAKAIKGEVHATVYAD